jgi:hypothetical protein
MKNIYHIHQSSNSYHDNSWTDTDYILCESEEEYTRILNEHKAKRKAIEDEYNENPDAPYVRERYHRLTLSKEEEIKASEYFYGHEWCGKHFTAFGFCWTERLERSTHYHYYLKPGSVKGEGVDSSVGKPTYYGS